MSLISKIAFSELLSDGVRNGLYKSKEFMGRGMPVVKMGHLYSNKILTSGLSGFDLFEVNTSEKVRFSLSTNDLLFARTSVVPEGVGLCSFVQEIKHELLFESNIIRARVDDTRCNPKYVFYYFQSPAGRGDMLSIANGAAIRTIRGSDLVNLIIPVPAREIQNKIAAILSAYDDLIDNNRKRIALLEKAARLLYEEWFVRLQFPGHEHTPVVDGVPEGWKKYSAFDAVEVLSGGTPKTSEGRFWDGEIPFYTPKDSWGSIYAIDTLKNLTTEGLASCNSKLYPKNTLFITARGTVGNLNLAQRPMAMNQSCYALRGKGNMSPFFLYLAMKDAVEVVKSKAVGSVFDAIVVDTFKQIPFLNPSSGIMDGFQSTITPIFNQVENLMLQNIRLQAARDLLLPRLMSGELAV